ncbi:F-box protein At1g30790-like [Capsella rubella]|uniref:F-box protein At1g30790-like n=1 Tax=Capsella rubella TaxID=81985 RepID=UPI000CD5C74C|nr:F-box protein At1g30790-like [Capsella rubella]
MFLDYLVHEFITLGGGEEVSRSHVTTAPYYLVTDAVYINGSIYYGAWAPKQRMDTVIVCFDVRHKKIRFIKAPRNVVFWETESILMDYRRKLASVLVNPYSSFRIFGLLILEDTIKHEWSKQTFELPNKAGEIMFSPNTLPPVDKPFFIFYYNVENKDMRRVRLHGVATYSTLTLELFGSHTKTKVTRVNISSVNSGSQFVSLGLTQTLEVNFILQKHSMVSQHITIAFFNMTLFNQTLEVNNKVVSLV